MALPIDESTHRILKCYELDGQIKVERLDGSFETINKAHGRFWFSDDDLQVCVFDAYFEIEYWSDVATFESGTAVVGDKTAINTYLSGFVGSI